MCHTHTPCCFYGLISEFMHHNLTVVSQVKSLPYELTDAHDPLKNLLAIRPLKAHRRDVVRWKTNKAIQGHDALHPSSISFYGV